MLPPVLVVLMVISLLSLLDNLVPLVVTLVDLTVKFVLMLPPVLLVWMDFTKPLQIHVQVVVTLVPKHAPIMVLSLQLLPVYLVLQIMSIVPPEMVPVLLVLPIVKLVLMVQLLIVLLLTLDTWLPLQVQ